MIKRAIKIQGIALIEVLIATVVISTGVLAVTLLLIQLMQGSDDVHLHSQAQQLATNKLESFKNNVSKQQFDMIQSGSDSYIDYSGRKFDINWTVNTVKPIHKTISIEVKSEHILSTLSYDLVWNDPTLGLSLATHGSSIKQNLLSFNKEDWLTATVDILPKDISKQLTLEDVGKLYQTEQGEWFLKDTSGNIQIAGESEPKEDLNELIHKIQGRIFIPKTIKENFQSRFFLEVSGGGFCTFIGEIEQLSFSGWAVLNYQCVVSKKWRGKIGLLSLQENIKYCPSGSREYLAYQIDMEKQKLKLTAVTVPQTIPRTMADYIILGNSTATCESSVVELNLLLSQDETQVLIAIDDITKSIVIDDQHVDSFSGKIGHQYKIKKIQYNLIAQGNSYPVVDYICRNLSPVNETNIQFHCALLLENDYPVKNIKDDWQGEMEVDIEFWDNDKNLSECYQQIHIDTSVARQYELSCNTK